jgi:hypothetical protein
MPTVIYNKGKSKKEFPYNAMGKVQATRICKNGWWKIKNEPGLQNRN